MLCNFIDKLDAVESRVIELERKLCEMRSCMPAPKLEKSCITCKHKTYEFEKGKVRCALWSCDTDGNMRCQHYG